jgi:hypothetical protein
MFNTFGLSLRLVVGEFCSGCASSCLILGLDLRLICFIAEFLQVIFLIVFIMALHNFLFLFDWLKGLNLTLTLAPLF